MDDLRVRLAKAGIELHPPRDDDALESPWYVKVLQALGGWVAAIFLFAFLGAGFFSLFEHEAAALAVGAILVGGACVLLRAVPNIFVEHLVLAGSLAGQALMVIGFAGLADGWDSGLWWLVFGLQAVLIIIMPNFIHRIFSAFSASIALVLAMADMAALYVTSSLLLLAVVWLWLHELKFPAHRRAFHATAYGLLLGLVTIQYMMRFNVSEFGHQHAWLGHWAGIFLTAGTLAYLACCCIQRLTVQPTTAAHAVIALGVLLLSGISIWAYGVTQGVAVLVLGFAISHRRVMAIGVVSMLFSISSYYYLLEVTLLHKSFTLAVLGSLLLALRWGMNHWRPGPPERHPHA